jgi:hypothetical protein
MSLRTLPAASRRARPCAPSESDRVSAGRDAHQAVDCGQRSTGIERSSHPACSGLYVLSVISSRLHIAWVPLAFIPKSRRADKSVGRNGYRLGRCTNCHSWVRATSTRIKTARLGDVKRVLPSTGRSARNQSTYGSVKLYGTLTRETSGTEGVSLHLHKLCHPEVG